MIRDNNAILCVIGIMCIWPAIVALIGVRAYIRYTEGGWRAVFFGKAIDR